MICKPVRWRVSVWHVSRKKPYAKLALTKGNREQTAKLLGLGERTLYRKLKEYGLR